MKIKPLFAALMSISLPAAVSCADVVYSNISRSATASNDDVGPLTLTNNSVGFWERQVFRYNRDIDPAPPPYAEVLHGGGGFASHYSSIEGMEMSANLIARAWDGDNNYGGSASSRFTASFTLTSPQQVEISGGWFVLGGVRAGSTSAYLLLNGPQGTLYFSRYLPAQEVPPPAFPSGGFAFSQLLPPGTYTIDAQASMSYRSPDENLGFRVSHLGFALRVPSPGATAALCCMAGFAMTRRRSSSGA